MLAKGVEGDQYQQQNIQSEPAGETKKIAGQRNRPILDQRAQSSSNVSTAKSSVHLMGSRSTELRTETEVHHCKAVLTISRTQHHK